MSSMADLMQSSHTSGSNTAYLENLYEQYLIDPSSLSADWKSYFDALPGSKTKSDTSHQDIIKKFKNLPKNKHSSQQVTPVNEKQIKVIQLIQAYRHRGHTKANLDPLGLSEVVPAEDLTLEYHGLNKGDLQTIFQTDTLNIGKASANLQEIFNALNLIYCGQLGIEYHHITNNFERRWFQERIEPLLGSVSFNSDEQQYIYQRLCSADGLAKFLASKYPGMKRFGIEGAESLIPLLDSLIQNCGIFGAKQICIGMAHRGRLNLLVNVLGKTPKELFSAFDEDLELKGVGTGDVKYHLGHSSNILTPAGEVHVSLSNNPSHLEIVNPVVEGSVRARQDRIKDTERNLVVPLLLHGDASFAGQGVVMETLQMSQTRGYGVGGTIHVIVNNQIGFTTSQPNDARSTHYATDVAKMIEAPILHVNSDNPELVVFAAKLAAEYRDTFKKDIIIDMVCYRRRGHNEADDPTATQPLMYKAISSKPSVKETYEKKLVESGILTTEECATIQKTYRKSLESGNAVALNLATKPNENLWFDWMPYMNKSWKEQADTNISIDTLEKIANSIFTSPKNFNLQKQVEKIYQNRKIMAAGKIAADWGFGELMAYGTLLKEGYPIRMTGQDVRRGTFSHRHAVIVNQDDGEGFIPLTKIADNAGTSFDMYDSLLSEEAVLGFEYGYAATWPSGLVIWEAQFGDFANGAQVVIDQFISSAEHKWERLSGLVMLLPHGYEGQGPEHSSARIERFLQLCAFENIQVCIPTTPAQIFHLLRLQAKRPMRKPLVIISPKSLLRNPKAVSNLEEFTQGSFQFVIDDERAIPEKIERALLCSGKVFYDLDQKRDELKDNKTAIIRIEQLYSFPYDHLELILKRYPNIKKVIWCQEEPMNQGAWFSHQHRIQRVLDRLKIKDLSLLSRPASSAPAVGLNKLHLEQQAKLIDSAFND
jgi:2-oxoglutarate dehydrogenase E1 component